MDSILVGPTSMNFSGRGVFTTVPKRAGDTVMQFRITREVSNSSHDNDVQLGQNRYAVIPEPEVLVNHSCDPNCLLDSRLTLTAIRNIPAGEELTFDYSTVVFDDWTMSCSCGASCCRGTIGASYYSEADEWDDWIRGL